MVLRPHGCFDFVLNLHLRQRRATSGTTMGAAGGFTLAIFKPHLVRNPVAYAAVQQLIESSGLRIVTSKRLQLTEPEAKKFYREHEGRFFHRRLISLMTSGPLEVLILSGENAIARWRELLGPTKVYKAVYSHPDCLRSLYGISDTRNAGHGSDSVSSFRTEAELFFPNWRFSQDCSEEPTS